MTNILEFKQPFKPDLPEEMDWEYAFFLGSKHPVHYYHVFLYGKDNTIGMMPMILVEDMTLIRSHYYLYDTTRKKFYLELCFELTKEELYSECWPEYHESALEKLMASYSDFDDYQINSVMETSDFAASWSERHPE